MAHETGKQRRSRIEPTYYTEELAQFTRRRRLWVLVALVVLAGWFALAPVRGDRGRSVRLFHWDSLASHGPLAKPHAMWDHDCQRCHTAFDAINPSRWTPAAVWSASSATNTKCQTCHAGPPHHANAPDDTGCAECHRDHRGRDASLVAIADASCTRCHANVSAHRLADSPKLAIDEHVTRFDAQHHPEFAAVREGGPGDPGRVRFNHALHLAKGMTLEPGGKPFVFGMLPEPDRARYGFDGKDLADAVQLDCRACHVLDDDGAYYRPIRYDSDCRSCHPLGYDPDDPTRQMRHGLTPGDVLEALRAHFAARAVRDDPGLLAQPVVAPERRLPGRALRESDTTTVGAAVEAKVLTSARLLFGAHADEAARAARNLPISRRGCVECHELSPDGPLPLIEADELKSVGIVPPGVPDTWFSHALFNHTAHRALECMACHGGVAESTTHRDLFLPKRDTCLTCHGPPPGALWDRSPTAKASGECVECHRYHRADVPLPGVVADALGTPPTPPMTLEEFLSGGHKR